MFNLKKFNKFSFNLKRFKLKLASLSGEWWISGGQAMFADGDIGDMNHEAFVIEYLKNEILGHFDIYDSEFSSLESSQDEIFRSLVNDGFAEEDEYDDFINDGSEFIKRTNLYKDPKQAEEAWFLAYGSSTRTYANDYALKYLKWKRMVGNTIQTQTISSNDLNDIANGIYDAYGEEAEGEEFTIEVNSTRKIYYGVPFHVIESRNPTELNEFRSGY